MEHLSTEQIELLVAIEAAGLYLSESEDPIVLRYLSRNGLINHGYLNRINGSADNGIYSSITPKGKAILDKLTSEQSDKARKERIETCRWRISFVLHAIATIIAIAAFVKSFFF